MEVDKFTDFVEKLIDVHQLAQNSIATIGKTIQFGNE